MLDQFQPLKKEYRWHLMLLGAPCLEPHMAKEVANDVFAIAAGTLVS